MKTSRKQMSTADFHLEVKEIKKDGTFTGYGSVFDVEDLGGDIVAPGAFKDTLAELKQTGKKIPVLWQHKSDSPIGVYDRIEEDDTGLFVEGRLLTDTVQLAKEAFSLLQAGAVTGLSIGYGTQEYKMDTETYIRTLLKVDLWEVSLVTFPMNEEAQAQAVKNAIRMGNLPASEREFEKFLRDAGFSKSNATTIASHGIKGLLQGDPAAEKLQDIGDLLKSFTLNLT